MLSFLSETLLEKEQEATVEEAFECLNALRQLSLENQAKKLKSEIARLERNGDTEKILPLIKQIREMKEELSILSQRNYQNLSSNKSDFFEEERS